MKRYAISRGRKGKVLCLPVNHPTRRPGIRWQAERQDPPGPHPSEEVVGHIEDTRKIGGARTW